MLWEFALRSTEHGALILNESGIVTWANGGAEKILAAPGEKLINRDFATFFTRRDMTKGIPSHELAVALASGTASDDRWMVRLDRSRFWASGVTAYIGAEVACCSYLKLFRDLTEFKMQLETARRQAQSAGQVSERLTAGIAVLAHELRNPLAGISLGAEMLQSRTREDEKTASLVDAIAGNANLAGRLIEDLMEHSKLSSDGFRLERSVCTLRELLQESCAIALRQMGQEDRNVRVLVPGGEIELRVDKMRLQQVFVNLITNALRYTPAPGNIWVSGTIEGRDVIVRVSDEGVGIDPIRLESLFELFTGAHLKGSMLGLGVGLAQVKKIVELHGGSVQARSEGAGKGSQFIVRFPLHE
jgi:two-component system CheB/CheR fusion protein